MNAFCQMKVFNHIKRQISLVLISVKAKELLRSQLGKYKGKSPGPMIPILGLPQEAKYQITIVPQILSVISACSIPEFSLPV